MTTTDKFFEDEEKVRKAREAQGREHDCREAGCTVAPGGLPATDLNRAERKPLDQDVLDAIDRLKDAGVID